MKGKTLIQIFMAENGRKGGKKSRRKLSKREARRIASAGWEGAVGEARRAKLRAKTHNAAGQRQVPAKSQKPTENPMT